MTEQEGGAGASDAVVNGGSGRLALREAVTAPETPGVAPEMCSVPARRPGMPTPAAPLRVIRAGGAISAGRMAAIPMLSAPALAGRPERWRGDPSAAVPERPDG